MTKQSRPKSRAYQLAVWFVLLMCAPLSGCLTGRLLFWSLDEVVIMGSNGDPGEGESPKVILNVHNVKNVTDGWYALESKANLSNRILIEAEDGFLEARPVEELTLEPKPGGIRHPAPWFFRIDADDALTLSEDAEQGAVAAFVEQDDDWFRVHLFHANIERNRWVRVGVIDIGPGTQLGARPLALVALPAAVAFDIYTWPYAVAVTLVLTYFDEKERREERLKQTTPQ